MELQSLIMGVLVAVLAFAVKTGLGWAYLWRRRGPGRRLWPTLGVLVLYALVFGLVLLLVRKVDLLSNYHVLEPLWRGGQTIHWLMAILLFIWGILLLRSRGPEEEDMAEEGEGSCACGDGRGSFGFLALIIPCPVCLSVVTMSLACLVLYFPDQALVGAGILYLGFVLTATMAGLALICGALGTGENLERSLGLAMTTIASYFMISALVLPQFGQIDRVYRLASYAGDEGKNMAQGGLWLIIIVAALIVSGFLLGHRKSSFD